MPAANAYVQLAEDTARRITHSRTEWTGFLKTAARLYKYPYHEQLMIYAQRPEATACADYRVWNDRMRRYIRRGSKGIALLDVSGDEPKLRYVFDIADTGTRAASRPFAQWQLTEQNEEAARRALEDGYDVTGSLEKQIHAAVQQLVMNQWLDHRREILGIVDGSYLEGTMNSTSELPSERPPPSALNTPCCPAAGAIPTNALSMRISCPFSTGIPRKL